MGIGFLSRRLRPPEYRWLVPEVRSPVLKGQPVEIDDEEVLTYLRSGQSTEGGMTDGTFVWREWFAISPTVSLKQVRSVVEDRADFSRAVADIGCVEHAEWTRQAMRCEGWSDPPIFPGGTVDRFPDDLVQAWLNDRDEGVSALRLHMRGMILAPSASAYAGLVEDLVPALSEGQCWLGWRELLEWLGCFGTAESLNAVVSRSSIAGIVVSHDV